MKSRTPIASISLILFPSPCGEEVMKFYRLEQSNDGSPEARFPSPCGEEVMKFTPPAEQRARDHYATYVSVPLRGRGNEIVYKISHLLARVLFPSPCGEEVMKYTSFKFPIATMTCFRPLAGKR